jgi:hypothetical protein
MSTLLVSAIALFAGAGPALVLSAVADDRVTCHDARAGAGIRLEREHHAGLQHGLAGLRSAKI